MNNKCNYTFPAIIFAMIGPIIPGIVPAVFVIPISTPANLGAISMWLIKLPAKALPPSPVPIDMNVTDKNCESPRYPQSRRKVAVHKKAIYVEIFTSLYNRQQRQTQHSHVHVKSFLTICVEQHLALSRSAVTPEPTMTNKPNRYGIAEYSPFSMMP